MLGDWVLFPEGIGRVVHIGIEFIIARVDEHERMRQVNDIKPIPLTAEILEKNGWVNGQFYSKILIGGWQIMNDCEHIAARNEDGWSIDIPCRFVHELQHALRLCGIEKEIEL